MTVALVITDGRRDYMARMMDNAAEMIDGFRPIIIDDSGDHRYMEWLVSRYPKTRLIHHNNRRGLAGAVRSAWLTALSLRQDYVLHLEDDFVFSNKVPVEEMDAIMDANPSLAQMSLKRQAWSEEEKAAGGCMEVNPDVYTDCDGWCRHTYLFTFNPSLIRVSAMAVALGTDASDGLERGVTDALLAKDYCFGVFGARTDPPRCEHIGERRSAGYRW